MTAEEARDRLASYLHLPPECLTLPNERSEVRQGWNWRRGKMWPFGEVNDNGRVLRVDYMGIITLAREQGLLSPAELVLKLQSESKVIWKSRAKRLDNAKEA